MNNFDQSFSFLNLLEQPQLQKLQDRSSIVGEVFSFCLDPQGKQLTQVSGSEEETQLLFQYIDMEQCLDVCRRTHASLIEDLQVEDTYYPWIKIAAVDVKVSGKSSVTWCYCAILSDCMTQEEVKESGFTRVTTTENFMRFLDLSADVNRLLLDNGCSRANAEAEIARSRNAEQEMGTTLKRLGATTEVVQLLDRDDAIEAIMADFLRIAGRYLEVSSARIYRLPPEGSGTETETLTQWQGNMENPENLEGKTIVIPADAFWNQDKPVVVSTGSNISSTYQAQLNAAGIKAIASIPIYLNQRIGMYACFYETKGSRTWTIEAIRYMNDAVKVLQSILTRRIQKNSLAGSFASLEAILDNVGCGIYVWDKDQADMPFINRFVRNTFSREIREGILHDIFGSRVSDDKESGSYEVHYFERSRWYDFYYTRLNWMNGNRVLLCSLYDITDKKIYQQKIEQQAYTDFLTGLYNRMCCERDLAKFVDTAKKNHTRGALLYMDLDDFKHINDGLGHQYGDVLLRSIAHSVQHITGISNSCYRMGGDEFVIIIPPDIIDQCNQIIERIQDIFSKPWFLKGADYYCTMSMGIVTFPDDGDNVEDLIRKADISMYDAKKTGKNRVARYADSADPASGKRLDMEKNMRDATLHGCDEFEIYYQPIIDVQQPGRPCTGAEALVRWNSCELGFVSPADFIPLAEYLGLINPIGSYILQKACEDCKRWNDNGFPGYKVNVNLSVVQLLQPDIVTQIRQTIEKTGINPHNLTLEVTESLAINDMHRMKEVLGDIKKLGARIALDDFGTGYSSLSHIREIPLDVIKVDQSFVRDLAEDSYPQAFIRMVAELASTIGVQVCVEGIETEAQYRALDGMNVRMIQGYYFDRPMKQKLFEEKYATPGGEKNTCRK